MPASVHRGSTERGLRGARERDISIMNSDLIDNDRLKHEIEHLIEECTLLKGVLRTRWTKPMADEQRRHVHVRRKLTDRFVLLAHLRGKRHVIHAPRSLPEGEEWDAVAWNVRVAERIAPDYARASVEAQPEAAR
jgi:hypothetical protein